MTADCIVQAESPLNVSMVSVQCVCNDLSKSAASWRLTVCIGMLLRVREVAAEEPSWPCCRDTFRSATCLMSMSGSPAHNLL